jgi:hydroxymethylbilane synthase
MRDLVIGTRGSDLALWQARWTAKELGDEATGIRLEIIRTEGDRAIDISLAETSERGIFTRDIERALLDRRIDIAVHSLKDLPTTLPEGLALGAIPPRADASDLLLVRPDALADDPGLPLARGARVGTGSPRRAALLAWLRPDLAAAPFRGNVPTRVEKCVRGDVDAIVLARAGVSRLRLDVSPLVAFDLAPATWLPAPAQGALGLEVRDGDHATVSRLAPLRCEETHAAVSAERQLLVLLEAGCHAALGAWCRRVGSDWALSVGALAPDGCWHAADVSGPDPLAMVDDVAAMLVAATPARSPEAPCWTPAARW